MPGGVGGLGREPHPTRLTQDFNPGEIKYKHPECHRHGPYRHGVLATNALPTLLFIL